MECPSVPEKVFRTLIRIGNQGEDTVTILTKLLGEIALWRPMLAKPALHTITCLATHENDKVSSI